MTSSNRSASDRSAPGSPDLVGLLLDAYEEFTRVAAAVPRPGQGGALGRLNSAGWIVTHIAKQQDAYWNVAAQGLAPDEWLAEGDSTTGSEAPNPRYSDARAALERITERSAAHLETLRDADLDRVVYRSRGGHEQNARALLARSAAHIFAHAGELTAIASLVGAPDLGLPGRLPRSTG